MSPRSRRVAVSSSRLVAVVSAADEVLVAAASLIEDVRDVVVRFPDLDPCARVAAAASVGVSCRRMEVLCTARALPAVDRDPAPDLVVVPGLGAMAEAVAGIDVAATSETLTALDGLLAAVSVRRANLAELVERLEVTAGDVQAA